MNESASIWKIGLLGPYGFGNLGDAAIQDAAIHNIKKYLPGAEIYGFSLNPPDTEQRHNIKSFPILRPTGPGIAPDRPQKKAGGVSGKLKAVLMRIPLVDALNRRISPVPAELRFMARSYKILKEIDILLISGGGQIHDYWGGHWGHPYALFKWALLAKASRTKLLFLSVGAEAPLGSFLSRFFIKVSLLLADYRSYRDETTKAMVEAMGIRRAGPVYPDLAYSLPVSRGDRHRNEDRLRIVGVSPIAARAWINSGSQVYKNYINELTSLILWLFAKDYRVSFFPSQIRMDPPVINDIIGRLNDHGILSTDPKIILNNVLTVDDLIAQISMVDIVIASRLHGVLISTLMHKPVLALSYSRKVNILMEEMELSSYCVNIDCIDQSVRDTFNMLEANYDSVVKQITRKVSTFGKLLEDQYEKVCKHNSTLAHSCKAEL